MVSCPLVPAEGLARRQAQTKVWKRPKWTQATLTVCAERSTSCSLTILYKIRKCSPTKY